jgi:hypothetical protein
MGEVLRDCTTTQLGDPGASGVENMIEAQDLFYGSRSEVKISPRRGNIRSVLGI